MRRARMLARQGRRPDGHQKPRDPDDLIELVAALLLEMYSAFWIARGSVPKATRRHYASERAIIEIIPDPRVLSRVHAKLKPPGTIS